MAIVELSLVSVLIFLGLATLSTGKHAFKQDKLPALRRLPSTLCHLRCAKDSNKVRWSNSFEKCVTVSLVWIRVERSSLSNNSHLSTAVVSSSLDVATSACETYHWFYHLYDIIKTYSKPSSSLRIFHTRFGKLGLKIQCTKKIVENYTNSPSSRRILNFVVFPVCAQTGCFENITTH